mmetsp:Transcript_10373/g.23434  ORF Transcript_10373/g.23434 Transcript_10373/m.23434 type:complete len:241 (-) Transcript_10373:78-800(-)
MHFQYLAIGVEHILEVLPGCTLREISCEHFGSALGRFRNIDRTATQLRAVELFHRNFCVLRGVVVHVRHSRPTPIPIDVGNDNVARLAHVLFELVVLHSATQVLHNDAALGIGRHHANATLAKLRVLQLCNGSFCLLWSLVVYARTKGAVMKEPVGEALSLDNFPRLAHVICEIRLREIRRQVVHVHDAFVTACHYWGSRLGEWPGKGPCPSESKVAWQRYPGHHQQGCCEQDQTACSRH